MVRAQGRGRSQGWVPNHHGAWAMVLLPYVLALVWAGAAGEFHPAVAVLGPTWLLGYFAFFAAGLWLKSRFKPRYRSAVVTYCGITLALGIVLLALQPRWWVWGLVFGPLTAAGLWFSWRRDERSLLSDLVTVAAACLLPLVVSPTLHWVSLVCFGYFFGTVFYVKTNIRERGRLDFIVYSLSWHLAFAVLFTLWDVGPARWWLVAFFAATAIRAWLVPWLGAMRGRPASAKALGIGEIITTLLLAAILVPALAR
ncbi:MAG: YwiC-like family protein [Propionibacteriaceae bacterium]|nr:YwiC-like family protein [Propionibacteriaceae bacterium]